LSRQPSQSDYYPIEAHDDVELNTLPGLDGENLFVVYLASMGKK
jgi:hypothetical protein